MPVSAVLPLTYPIVETFHSQQGEGFWTGAQAFFIRLAGCDVHCPWCDTKASWSMPRYPQHSIDELIQEIQAKETSIVIITGGEPLMHDLKALTQELHHYNFQVHLETSGAHPFSGEFDWVTFSPKQFKPPHPSVYDQVNELKVVITQTADLAWAEQQAVLLDQSIPRYLQPEWSTPGSLALILDYVAQHPEWRLSLQTHKYLGIQ